MARVHVDLTFPHTYDLDTEADLPPGPGGYSRFYYPGATTDGGHADLMLLVEPANKEPWYGCFSGPTTPGRAANGVWSCPNMGSFCVVAHGRGYIIQAEDPTDWSEAPIHPVIEVRPVPGNGILLISDFTRVAAYGPGGLAWSAHPSEVTDDLVMDRVSGGRLLVRGYNYATGDVEAAIDLLTGAVVGGGADTAAS